MKRIKCLVRTNFIGSTFIYQPFILPTYRQNISSNNLIVVGTYYIPVVKISSFCLTLLNYIIN